MNEKKKVDILIPIDHPRHESLEQRHKIIEGMKKLVVAEAGVIAHGRGECFDYILGEKTSEPAKRAIKAAVALLLISKNPIISVNGNVAALIPNDLVTLSGLLNAALEINLFYRKPGRVEAIADMLREAGANAILGENENEMVEIEELSSNRRRVDCNGIKIADTVFVPLEDGDRTEALKKIGKNVIAVDLNPLSRTSLWADITIVDNIVRVLPQMLKIIGELKLLDNEQLKEIVSVFNNKQNIQDCLDLIIDYITLQKEEAFKILEK